LVRPVPLKYVFFIFLSIFLFIFLSKYSFPFSRTLRNQFTMTARQLGKLRNPWFNSRVKRLSRGKSVRWRHHRLGMLPRLPILLDVHLSVSPAHILDIFDLTNYSC
jgi:hypothetical protein